MHSGFALHDQAGVLMICGPMERGRWAIDDIPGGIPRRRLVADDLAVSSYWSYAGF
jgi:hypothetical protein